MFSGASLSLRLRSELGETLVRRTYKKKNAQRPKLGGWASFNRLRGACQLSMKLFSCFERLG